MHDYIDIRDSYDADYDPSSGNSGGPDFFDRQGSFYDWTESVGIYSTWDWSREQFRNYVAKNPDRPDIWKFQVGAIAAPIGRGGTRGEGASYLDGDNFFVPFIWVFGTIFSIILFVVLSFVSPLALLGMLIIPGFGLFRHIGAINAMKRTWGQR